MALSAQDFEQLCQLERDLTEPGKLSIETVARLLAEDFSEIGTSGKVYDKAQTLEALSTTATDTLLLSEFKGRCLSKELVLLNFHSLRTTSDGQTIAARRSSLWQRSASGWCLLFHQASRL